MKRFKSAHREFFQPTFSQNNPVGDAELYIKGASQPLNFKHLAMVFPEKIIFDLELNCEDVQHHTDVTIIPNNNEDAEKQPRVIAHIYGQRTVAQTITWGEPRHIRFMHQGVMCPKDASWSLTIAEHHYAFETLLPGNLEVHENQHCQYGGVTDQSKFLDTLTQTEAVFWIDSEEIILHNSGTGFGDDVRHGGIRLSLSKADDSILSSSILYKMNQNPALVDEHSSPPDEIYEHLYISGHYEMITETMMRVYCFPES